jgi:prepilin-type N-terminal cleavage/methylation domain-containing protein
VTKTGGRRSRTSEAGFTLIEMVVVVALSAFMFAGLAAVLSTSLRTLTITKARTQGNEVATQGIEDLQRFSYAQLGVCVAPPGAQPAGLTQTVLLSGSCPGGATSSYGESPCVTAAQIQTPSGTYTCTRINVVYTVTRYIAWTDGFQISKRLAVFVTWRDNVGAHTVSQQSSVRAPQVGSAIGLSPPALNTPSAAPSPQSESNGVLGGTLYLSVHATGLCGTAVVGTTCTGTPDKVYAEFATLDSLGNPTASDVPMTTSADGSTWTGTVSSINGFTFGEGSQFVTFIGLRNSDGKGDAIVTTPVIKFCPPSDSSCSLTVLPAFIGVPTVPTTVSITASGGLNADIAVSATLKNMTATDTVSVGFETLNGFVSVFLQPPTNPGSCTATTCTFSGSIAKSAGYDFAAGSRPLYFTGRQASSGSTAAAASSNVSFS